MSLPFINFHALSFWILSLLIVGTSLYVVIGQNIVRSALALIFTFVSVAGIYLTLNAEFLAVVQVLIYAGAIAVLIVFSIMLVVDPNSNVDRTSLFSKNASLAGYVSIALFFFLSFGFNSTSWNITYKDKVFSDIRLIANDFLKEHFIAFELGAVLLLVALVVAVLIIKEAKKDE